jgi:lycopene cyclase CruP
VEWDTKALWDMPSLLDWSRHYLNLAVYSGLYPLGKGLGKVLSPVVDRLSPGQRYGFQRRLEAWKYGSGGDFGE